MPEASVQDWLRRGWAFVEVVEAAGLMGLEGEGSEGFVVKDVDRAPEPEFTTIPGQPENIDPARLLSREERLVRIHARINAAESGQFGVINPQVIDGLRAGADRLAGMDPRMAEMLLQSEIQLDIGDLWFGEEIFDAGPGGEGGGGGFAAPVYKAPDRREIEDWVRGKLTSLVGSSDPDVRLQDFTDLYMKDHRRNWDSPSREIVPEMSVIEAIRNEGDYQRIHTLRPEGVDESAWIKDRLRLANAAGLSPTLLDKFGTFQAQVGATDADVTRAAEGRQFRRTSQSMGDLKRRMQGTIRNVMQGVA